MRSALRMRSPAILSLTLTLTIAGLLSAAGPLPGVRATAQEASQEVRRLGAIDLARIRQLYHITDTLGDEIWPGFDIRKIPIAVNNDDREELLAGHPDPPEEFRPFETPTIDGVPVMVRDGCTRYGPRGGGWAVNLGGVQTAYVSVLEEGRKSETYLSLLLHECFHCFQREYREWADGAYGDHPETDPVYSALLGLESRLLRAILDEPEEAPARELARMFVATRHERRRDLPRNLVLLEGEDEYSEGTATYSQARMYQLLAERGGLEPAPGVNDPQYGGFAGADSLYQRHISEIILPENMPIGFFHSMYNHGMAQCLVLDRLRPGWKEEMREKGMTMFTLLEREFPMDEGREAGLLTTAKERFSYNELLQSQTRLIGELLDTIRGYVLVSGTRYRLYHTDLPGGFMWKPEGPVYEIPESVEHELLLTLGQADSTQQAGAGSHRIVWAGGIRTFEKEGLTFASVDTPVIFGRPFLEWIDPDPAPDGSDCRIEFERRHGSLYRGLKMTTDGFTLETEEARIEESEGIVDIHPLQPDPSRMLHAESLVWDCHNDLSYRVLYEGLDIGQRLPAGHVDIPRLREGGVDVQTVALYIENSLYGKPGACSRQTRQLLNAMLGAIEKNSDAVGLARTAADIERITGEGRIAMPLAIEGGHAIEDDLGLLREFHRMGVSSMTLTHNVSHGWADSGADRARWGGLNDLGRQVVREMNRLGMVIDISHVSDETFYDVLEVTEDPAIASHSGCRALNPHRRNMSDEMLEALAENGGVICIVFVLNYLTPEYSRAMSELNAVGREWRSRLPEIEDDDLRIAIQHMDAGRNWPLEDLPTIEDVLDHIDHAVRVAGIDHVGLGADMYPRTPSPVGIRGVHDYPNITRGLKERGYSDEDIKKIMGGNLLRVWKEVTGPPSPGETPAGGYER